MGITDKKLLDTFGSAIIWNDQGTFQHSKALRDLKHSMENKFPLDWLNYIGSTSISGGNKQSSKLRTYKLFKSNFELENYLLLTTNISKRIEFAKLRVSAHKLKIESDRYLRPAVPPENMFCTLCNLKETEDESHFLLRCPFYCSGRNCLFSELDCRYSADTLQQNEREIFISLMSCNNGDPEIYVYSCTVKRNLHLGL